MSTGRLPAIFATHGGGPMPLLGHPSQRSMTAWLKGVAITLPSLPKAIIVFTAHWEEDKLTLSTSPAPPMLYDYYGFPPEAYAITYPAPGAPRDLVERVKGLLEEAGIPTKEDSKRGYDHGTFVPLALIYPDASISVLQMSLVSTLRPKDHIKIGAALLPLRDEGVLVIGSGSSYHNMKALMSVLGGQGAGSASSCAVNDVAKTFDDWLVETCTGVSGTERERRLEAWAQAPGGRASHPREEHLIPLMVVVGAAGSEAKGKEARLSMSNGTTQIPMSSFVFT